MIWSMIWHQAMTQGLMKGKAAGKKKTFVLPFTSPAEGKAIRLRFLNHKGERAYKVGGVTILSGGRVHDVCMEGKVTFEIPSGKCLYSDPLEMDIRPGEKMEMRIYLPGTVLDMNDISEQAYSCKGNQLHEVEPSRIPMAEIERENGMYSFLPVIDAVEILTEEAVKSIVCFGDSITQQSRWFDPLSMRLSDTYGDEFSLLNSGIGGNTLLYDVRGSLGKFFGEKGVDRFERDVLQIPNLHTVVFALGVNDVAYLGKRHARKIITFDNFTLYTRELVGMLRSRGVRVVQMTITPRTGFTRGRFTPEMEQLRVKLNEWIRTADLFDYVIDADEVLASKEDSRYIAEGLHIGDHLHPNKTGGEKIAAAIDLAKLTGK